MRKAISGLCLLMFVPVLGAQSNSVDNREQETIRHVKNVLVSSLDSTLPKVTLEYFLKYEGDGAPIRWEVNDCGEQSGDPELDRYRDFRMCVEADLDIKNGSVTVVVSAGTFKKGAFGNPSVVYVTITDVSGKVRTVRRLGDLPMELHRPWPKKQAMPKDLPPTVGKLEFEKQRTYNLAVA